MGKDDGAAAPQAREGRKLATSIFWARRVLGLVPMLLLPHHQLLRAVAATLLISVAA